jgi:hypothetical protein
MRDELKYLGISSRSYPPRAIFTTPLPSEDGEGATNYIFKRTHYETKIIHVLESIFLKVSPKKYQCHKYDVTFKIWFSLEFIFYKEITIFLIMYEIL